MDLRAKVSAYVGDKEGVKRAFFLVFLVFLADQISKSAILYLLELPTLETLEILPFLRFTMVWNKGISMGLPLGSFLGKYGIILLTSGISFYLIYWMAGTRQKAEQIGLAFIIGGALGNLIDRFLYGAVADFIHVFGFGYHFYVFNVADAAITLGACFLIGDSLRSFLKRPNKTRIDG